MLSEYIHTWTPDVWSFIDNTNDQDDNSLLNATEVAALQLQDLFGQDVFDFDTSDSPYYDEFTFVPNQAMEFSDMVTSETPKRRRSSTSSLSSYLSSSEVEDDEHSLSSRRSSFEEEEPMDKHALEEVILDKITNQLDPEKLPGILTIISSNVEDDAEEVEIDLARLDMYQLTKILLYIDECLQEKPLVEQGHVVSGKLYSDFQGPMSSVFESDSDSSIMRRKKRTKKRNKQKNNNHKKTKSISKKPKKKAAIHKRRLLEEMTTNNETDDDEGEITEGGDGILIFGDEQMDFAVTQNETIVHQQRRQSIIIQSKPLLQEQQQAEEDDELIDIML